MDNKATNRLIKLLGILFTVVSLWYVSTLVYNHFGEIKKLFLQPNIFWFIFLGLMLYAVTQINAVISWFLLLRDKYQSIPFRVFYVILAKSQIGKYIPGNFSHILGRSYLSKWYNIKITDVAKSIFAETILLLYVGFIIGSAYFIFFDRYLFGYSGYWFTAVIVVLTVSILGYLTIKRRSNKIWQQGHIIIKILLLNSLSFVALGALLYLAQYFLYDSSVSLIQFIVVAAVSFIAGFLMPGSPAGIGVREYVFISLLSAQMQIELVLTLALLFRLLTIIGDFLFFMSSFVIKKNVAYG